LSDQYEKICGKRATQDRGGALDDCPMTRHVFGWLLLLSAALSACDASPETALVAADSASLPLQQVPLGLPPLPISAGEQPTRARVALGRKLFMDARLSHNNTMSCAMCHVPEQGFASNELGTAVGMEGRSLRRNAPTLLNVAYAKPLFDDGREFTLENQIWGPLLAANEMGTPSVGYLIEKLKAMPDYRGLFEAAFAGRGPSAETIGSALASYERTLLSARSRFDRWYFAKEAGALNDQEKQGFEIFRGKGHCVACHSVGEGSALFTDNRFHNTGIGWARSMRADAGTHSVQLAPGVVVQVENDIVKSVSEPALGDVGRYEVTLNPSDAWAYRTPTLRNVALTAPYMHDGSFATLQEVVDFYDRGGIDNALKDPLVKPLQLTPEEKRALIAFLGTLTGNNVDRLITDARTGTADQKLLEADWMSRSDEVRPEPP